MGSIAEDPENDVYAILKEFCQRNRIPFAQVRNIKYIAGSEFDFYEAPHKSGYGLYDRALGVVYLNGIREALEKKTS